MCRFCNLLNCIISTPFANGFRDKFPVSLGHTLVVPTKHVVSLFDLSPSEQASIWELVASVRLQLLSELNPSGFNIGLNDGISAGQTVLHAHIHIIPRYHGDVPDPRGGIRWVIPEQAKYWD